MVYEAIVIGTSMGGMTALRELLKDIPQSFPAPILVVQHLSPLSDGYIVKYLDSRCNLQVKEVDEKEIASAGFVYIAPPNYHLLVGNGGSLLLSAEEKVNFARPSIDVLFETAADVYKDRLIGIVLTGANSDGSNGARYIKKKGGVLIVQNPHSAESSAMPHAAINNTYVDYILDINKIGIKLIELVGDDSWRRK